MTPQPGQVLQTHSFTFRPTPLNVNQTLSPVGSFDGQHVQAIVRVIEASVQVRRRYQFFSWTQSYLQALLPHQMAVCGAYHRGRRDVLFEAFHSIAVPAALLSAFGSGSSPLMRELVGRWIERCGVVQQVDIDSLDAPELLADRDHLRSVGFRQLVMHGVCRPQRAQEVESLFILAGPQVGASSQQLSFFELLLPHLHSTWLRVQATERELLDAPASPVVARTVEQAPAALITDRERQILSWVREGMSNQEIAVELGISALTVKNHIQKILRKLGAANRAQAVAKAMTHNLLARVGAPPSNP